MKTNVTKTENNEILNTELELLNDTLNVSDEKLLDIDLDNLNFDSLLSNSTKMKEISEKSEKTKKESKKFELYKIKTTKADRQKLRNQLRKYCLNIFSVIESKDSENIKKFISDFLEFYKTNYKINDFTIDSLSYNNRDSDTEERINAFLELFKVLITVDETKKESPKRVRKTNK